MPFSIDGPVTLPDLDALCERDEVLADLRYIRSCVERRWFKGIILEHGFAAEAWAEPGQGPAHCLITPANTWGARRLMRERVKARGFLSAARFNNDPTTTKADVLAFVDECITARARLVHEGAV